MEISRVQLASVTAQEPIKKANELKIKEDTSIQSNKLDEIKKSIENGTYKVDLEKTAKAIGNELY